MMIANLTGALTEVTPMGRVLGTGSYGNTSITPPSPGGHILSALHNGKNRAPYEISP